MAKVRVKMIPAGARALLNSAEVQGDLLARVQRIQASAGEGFTADVQAGRGRAHGMVKTSDYESMRAQAKTNALLKALDSGR